MTIKFTEGSAVRRPAQAGRFYPADPLELRAEVQTLLASAGRPRAVPPKAMIAPHAGYIYSGPIAAAAYACLAAGRGGVKRVVLIGPAHFVGFAGLASTGMDAFATPLGCVPVDREGVRTAEALPGVRVLERAHAPEHCLEVQLPFLQVVLEDFRIVPLLVGEASTLEVSQVIDALWDGAETSVIVSSDLSHYQEYRTAQRMDGQTARAIEALDAAGLDGECACGWAAIRGLLEVARRRDLHVRALDLRNSGDTAGSRQRVVGYGAFLFESRATGLEAGGAAPTMDP